MNVSLLSAGSSSYSFNVKWEKGFRIKKHTLQLFICKMFVDGISQDVDTWQFVTIVSGNEWLGAYLAVTSYLYQCWWKALMLYGVTRSQWGNFQMNQTRCTSDIGFKGRWNIKIKTTGGRLNKKDGLTRYGNSHVKDKTS